MRNSRSTLKKFDEISRYNIHHENKVQMSMSSFLGNKVLIQKLIEHSEKYPFKTLVFGSSGSGKTHLCRALIDERLATTLNILTIQNDHYEDMRTLKSVISNFLVNNTITSYFDKRNKVVFIDDIDILLSTERAASTYILSLLDDKTSRNQNVSYIFSCSNSEEKKMTEFKKKMTVFRITHPSTQDLFLHFSEKLDKIGTEYDQIKLLQLIETYQQNYRNIANNLFKITYTENASLTEEKQHRVLLDKTFFDMMKIVFTKKLTAHDIRHISDNSLVPMLLYENFYTELFVNREKLTSKKTYLDAIYNVSQSFCDGECVDAFMYNNQDWSLYDLTTIMKCLPINQYTYSLKSSKKFGVGNNYVFTQLLTKSALKCNFRKKIVEIGDVVGIHESEHMLFLFDLILEELTVCKKKHKIYNKYGLNAEQWSTICTYYSQFIGVEKANLVKWKK